MKLLCLLLIFAVCLTLLVPADAWGRRWRFRFRGRRFFRKVLKTYATRALTGGVLRRNCETKYAIGCTTDAELSEEQGSCKLRTMGCAKRELSEEEYLRDLSIFNVPFSRDIDDYDEDGDGFVDKDEFVEFVLSTIKPMQLKDPEDMMIPFEAADLDGDGVLSNEELELSEHFYGDDDDGNADDDNNDDDNV